MVVTYMQRKVHSRNYSIDEFKKVNSRMINICYSSAKYKTVTNNECITGNG